LDTLITWLIIALFYAPLHFLVPMLVVFIASADAPLERKARLTATAIDCTLSMTIAFSLVIWLVGERMVLAMSLLLVSMATPYLRIALQRRQVA
jgi:hypothetical protein